MADYAEFTGSRMYAVKDDHVVFDTNLKSVNLFPDANNIVRSRATGNPITVDFPDLLKANAHFRGAEGFYSGGRSECRSYTTLLYQEWGPDYPNADDYRASADFPQYWANLDTNYRNLAQEYIGTVPVGTDYIDVRVNMVNSFVPTPMLGLPIWPLMAQNVEVNLPGGSCPIEMRPPLVRLFEFKLIGRDVYLRRFQSVSRGTDINWISTNNDSQSSGWTWGNSPSYPAVNTPVGFYPHAELGRLAYLIEAKGPDTNGAKRRNVNGTNACSVVDPTNFRSVWYGDVIIRPGRRT